jgi:hypothetical protein
MKERIKHMIYEIKTFVYHLVGGQLSSKKQQQIENRIEYPFYLCRFTDDDWHKYKFDQIMTYIVAGKFNNNTFLMTDCVGTPPNGKHMFCNKLVKLKSTMNETYSTITGYDSFQTAINLFDRKCFENDIIFDVENKNHINEILEIYEHLKDNIKHNIEKNFLHSGLFFILNNKIVWYKIMRDENGKLEISLTSHIDNNHISEDFVDIHINNNQFNNPNEIINYCKQAIIKHYKRKEETKNLNLKDKFSFIMFNGDEKIKILPYSNNKEFVLSEIGCKYVDIEK